MVRQIELAITARLAQLMVPAGVTVESYGAQLDDETFAFVRTLPAQWVTFDAITNVKKTGRRTYIYTANFEVLSAQRHLADNARRLNDASQDQDMGAYELIERAKLALAGQKLGLCIQPMEPGAVRSVMKGMASRDAIAIYAQQFSTSWMETLESLDALPPGQAEGELITVGLNYLIKPGDDATDTSDIVTTNPTIF